ncbi:hypothetical protein ABZV75_19215 [Streptomyces flaveolus]|uniref:hypothetical protein n=1 Tax=Streptomyces flaveolus TaxID=67297 RepID=UPI0033B6A45D
MSGTVSSGAYDGSLVCQYNWALIPPGNWTTASRPTGSSKGATTTWAPLLRARRTPVSKSLMSQPVRSLPNGQGAGVLKSKTGRVPTGERTSSDSVVLGVGVTVVTTLAVWVPPKVASQPATNTSVAPGVT